MALTLPAGEEADHILVMNRVVDAKTAAIVVGYLIKAEHHFFPGIVQTNLAPFVEEEEWLTS